MGISGISFWQLLIVLLIIILLFGTTKLRNIGSDLGNAIKGFRSAVKDEEGKKDDDEAAKADSVNPKPETIQQQTQTDASRVINGEATSEKNKV